jgi:iron complex transport system substrate-binding protein
MYAATGIDLEQLANWDPEYIFFYNSADPETLVDSAAWSQLSAVRNGKYYSIPSGPYSFVSPPSINRYLGMIYIAKTVYPDLFDWDL